MSSLALGPDWLAPEYLVAGLGGFALAGVAFIIFAECGLLIGFFLPGDSLLFAAGLLVARDDNIIPQPLWLVCVVLFIAAMLGNLVGYYVGRLAGPSLFERKESRIFRKEYVVKTSEFFEKYGGRAIILARFVPIVRTFITAMAGVGRMDLRHFAFFSAVGALLWAVGLTVLGYYLGGFPIVAENIEVMALIIVAISLLPPIIEYLRARRSRTAAVSGDSGSSRD